ncbi:hypothetical protein ZWY2020_024741 [Hordeum vulgare]|nr:hypothetical protein ZWY2020_024741 [Hordeum vulgare]
MHVKIPKALYEAVISAFLDGVTDLNRKEELTMSDEMSTTQEMFNLANKCTRAEEGRLSLLGPQAAELEEKKTKAKEAKCKAPVVLVVWLRGRAYVNRGANVRLPWHQRP